MRAERNPAPCAGQNQVAGGDPPPRRIEDKSWHGEAGITRILSDDVEITAAVFHDRMDTEALFVSTSDGRHGVLLLNTSEFPSEGLRINVNRKFRHFDAGVGYTSVNSVAIDDSAVSFDDMRNGLERRHFQSIAGRFKADVDATQTEITAVYRWTSAFSPSRLDPYQHVMEYNDPTLSLSIVQNLPTWRMPVDLLESTLFGHLRGAFTSAIASKKGLFEVADQGTIFFDEIGTISMETQAKLLRVIQEKEFMRLGATETIKVDARIIAATNVDLKKLVEEGRFREDLYYRLNVINIQLPPLRERKEDIPGLVEFFTNKYCDENGKPHYRFSSEALKTLMDYHWPGNVRELENVVERAVVLSQDEIIGRDLLPESVISPSSRFATLSSFPLTKNTSLFEIIDAFERRVIIEMLEQTGWSQTEAADNFKIPLSTLNQKIKRHGIEIRKKRERPPAGVTTGK